MKSFDLRFEPDADFCRFRDAFSNRKTVSNELLYHPGSTMIGLSSSGSRLNRNDRGACAALTRSFHPGRISRYPGMRAVLLP